MSFRTRPRRGPSPGFSPPGNTKALRPEIAAALEAERFVQEINTSANPQHPHIFRKRQIKEGGDLPRSPPSPLYALRIAGYAFRSMQVWNSGLFCSSRGTGMFTSVP